jgi:hypothetical protein
MASTKKLLFIDTNIWLDFYRGRSSEAVLALLRHIESVRDQIIATHQLEMEYKNNRQGAIAQGYGELVPPKSLVRPGLFSNARAAKMVTKHIRAAAAHIEKLKAHMIKALEKPTLHDPVYKTCQRLFHRKSDLVLGLNNDKRFTVRRKAVRRYYLGCPPRKRNDTSIGDALNWEWMIACASEHNADLVIVSRDGDYGTEVAGQVYLNDHLKQEFIERVGKRRKAYLCTLVSIALKTHFDIDVSDKEREEEKAAAQRRVITPTPATIAATSSQLVPTPHLNFDWLSINSPTLHGNPAAALAALSNSDFLSDSVRDSVWTSFAADTSFQEALKKANDSMRESMERMQQFGKSYQELFKTTTQLHDPRLDALLNKPFEIDNSLQGAMKNAITPSAQLQSALDQLRTRNDEIADMLERPKLAPKKLKE